MGVQAFQQINKFTATMHGLYVGDYFPSLQIERRQN
jgi:hypothetical protein